MSYIFSLFAQMLSYPFLRRAFSAGILVALCAGLLGTALVPRRFSNVGNSLSQVGFAACSVALAMGWAPLAVSLPVVTAAAFLLFWLDKRGLLSGDAATALLSTGGLAAGALVLGLTTGMTTDVCNYLFGSVMSMTQLDAWLSYGLCAGMVLIFVLFGRWIFAVTFDPAFARAAGLPVDAVQLLLSVLTAITVVLGMRIMGTLLISGLILFPALAAMQLCRQYRTTVLCAAAISMACFALGLLGSYCWSTPTGATIVLADLAALALCGLVRLARRLRRAPRFAKEGTE